ncbi:MAG: TolC family protein [Opitutia bacterium]
MRHLLLFLCHLPLLGAAELTVADSLRLALGHHPGVLAADAGLRLRLAESLALEQRAAPRLEAELKDLGGEGGAEVRLIQPLRRGDLGLRAQYAAAERAAAEADGRARLIAVLSDTFQSHVALWAAQSQLALSRLSEAEAADLLRRVRSAVADGLLSPAALAQAEAAWQEARAAGAAAEAARLDASASLARRIGSPDAPVVAAPPPVGLPSDPAPRVDFALHRSDLRAALAAREAAARGRRAVARAEADTPAELGLLAEQRANGESWGVGIGFSLELPVPGRRRAAAEAAEAEVRAARAHPLLASPDAVAAEIRGRLAAAREAVAAVEAQAAALDARRRAAEAAVEALDEGLVDLPHLAESLGRLAEARRRDLELRLEALRARSRLEEALGGRLEQALIQ